MAAPKISNDAHAGSGTAAADIDLLPPPGPNLVKRTLFIGPIENDEIEVMRPLSGLRKIF